MIGNVRNSEVLYQNLMDIEYQVKKARCLLREYKTVQRRVTLTSEQKLEAVNDLHAIMLKINELVSIAGDTYGSKDEVVYVDPTVETEPEVTE